MPASETGNIGIIKYWIENKADVNIQDINYYLAIAYAYKNSNYEIVNYLTNFNNY